MAEQFDVDLAMNEIEEIEASADLARTYLGQGDFTAAYNELCDALDAVKKAQSSVDGLE